MRAEVTSSIWRGSGSAPAFILRVGERAGGLLFHEMRGSGWACEVGPGGRAWLGDLGIRSFPGRHRRLRSWHTRHLLGDLPSSARRQKSMEENELVLGANGCLRVCGFAESSSHSVSSSVLYTPAVRPKRGRARTGLGTVRRTANGNGHLGLETGIAITVQSASIFSKSGRVSEGEGGVQQWPKYSLRIITGSSCPGPGYV